MRSVCCLALVLLLLLTAGCGAKIVVLSQNRSPVRGVKVVPIGTKGKGDNYVTNRRGVARVIFQGRPQMVTLIAPGLGRFTFNVQGREFPVVLTLPNQ